MLPKLYHRLCVTLICVSGLLIVACQTELSKPTITVASKDFTEQFVVGEMYAILLENAGYPVVRKLNLGSTPVVHKALLEGTADIYPEYTGTGLLTVLKMPVQTDQQAVYETVAAAYKEEFGLTWLAAAPMNNSQALAMQKERAAALDIRNISDMAVVANQLIMAGPIEFLEREDGLVGLQQVYGGFELKEYRPIDPGLRYAALANGEVDIVVAFGTDGEISAFDLLVLEDDKGLWPPYQIAPVVRSSVLEANPEIEEILNQLVPLLTDETMQQLNNEVSSNGRAPADVAREFLQQEGLID